MRLARAWFGATAAFILPLSIYGAVSGRGYLLLVSSIAVAANVFGMLYFWEDEP